MSFLIPKEHQDACSAATGSLPQQQQPNLGCRPAEENDHTRLVRLAQAETALELGHHWAGCELFLHAVSASILLVLTVKMAMLAAGPLPSLPPHPLLILLAWNKMKASDRKA